MMRRWTSLVLAVALLCGVGAWAASAPVEHGPAASGAAEHPEDAQGGGGGLFHFDPGLQVWTLLTFLAVLVLLWKFAFGPIGRALEERERTIRGSVEDAKRRQQEAEELAARYKQQLEQAREESRQIVEEGRKLAENTRQEITHDAREESKRILDRTQGEIGRMQEKGVDELRETVAHLSVQIASQVLEREIDETAHRKIVDGFISDLRKKHGAEPR